MKSTDQHVVLYVLGILEVDGRDIHQWGGFVQSIVLGLYLFNFGVLEVDYFFLTGILINTIITINKIKK